MKSLAGIERCMVKGKVRSSNADQSFVLSHSSPCRLARPCREPRKSSICTAV